MSIFFKKKFIVGIIISTKKYKAINKLSATKAAEFISLLTPYSWDIAAKLTEPPMYVPVNIGIILCNSGIRFLKTPKAAKDPKTVPNALKRYIIKNFPVSLPIFFIFALNNNIGTASGTT